MVNQELDIKDKHQDDNCDIDLAVVQTLSKIRTLTNKRDYNELPYNQKIEVSRLNKTLTELYWQGFESASKDKDYDKAVRYFIKAFELGSSKAINLYSETKAQIFWKMPGKLPKLEQLDDPSFKYKSRYELALLGVRYTLGLGLPPNDGLALYCFRKAAEYNNILGLLGFGMAYELGKGVKKNEDKALELYLKALDKIQYSKSTRMRQKKLPLIFQSYQIINQLDLIQHAALKGHARAQFCVGIHQCLYDMPIDKKRAYWLQLAAEQGYENAFSLLATYYVDEEKEPSSINKAIHWYRLTIQSNTDFDRMHLLSLPYNLGSYFIALENKDAMKLAEFLLNNSNLRTEFLKHDLQYILQNDEDAKFLSQLINCLTNSDKTCNPLLVSVFIYLVNNTAQPSTEMIELLRYLISVIQFAETESSQIADLLPCIITLETKYPGVFDCLKYIIHILWHRAQGLRCELGQSIYQPAASLLLRLLCREAYTFNPEDIKPFHVSLLCALQKNNKISNVEAINALFQTNLLKVSVKPENKHHLFFAFSKTDSKLTPNSNSLTV